VDYYICYESIFLGFDMGNKVKKIEGGHRGDTKGTKIRDPGSTIRSLQCFAEVDEMVRGGAFVRQVVTFIHQSGELTDMSREAVSYLVRDYRDYVFSDSYIADGVPRDNRLEDDDPFYELHSLRKYFKAQEARIDMEVGTERDLTKLFSTTQKEFAILEKLATSIMKKKEQYGLISNGKPGSSSCSTPGSAAPGRVDVSKVVANPESRQRVMGFVEALMEDPELLDNLGENTRQENKKKFKKHKKNKK